MEVIYHPKSEIDSRIKRFQENLSDLDGAFIFQLTDMVYFSGTSQEGLLWIPVEGEPSLMIRKDLERAKEESPLDAFPLKSFKTLMDDLELDPGMQIGLEMDVLPTQNYMRLSRMPVDFRDVSKHVMMTRSVKSQFEQNLIRESGKLIDTGIASAKEHLREGMTEVELAGKIESELRTRGHQGALNFRRFNNDLFYGHVISGPDATIPSFLASPTGGRGSSLTNPQGAGFRKIQRNEPVLVDFVGAWQGYLADEARIFCIGSLSDEFEQAHQAALELQKYVSNMLKPGANAREIYESTETKAMDLGYNNMGGPPGQKCGFVGHGVGLEIDEFPVLAPMDMTLEAGNVIAVEPKLVFPEKGVVGIENTYIVGEDGAENINKLDWEIWRV